MPEPDWITALEGPSRLALLDALRALPLEALRTQPPPRLQGLPFGFEPGIFLRHLRGQTCQFSPSGFASLYRRRLTSRESATFSALVLGTHLSRGGWIDLLGQGQFEAWLKSALLAEGSGDAFTCRFRVRSIGPLTLVVDPLNIRFENRVHLGSDSLKMIEFLERRTLPRTGRFLDVGTGSGAILLHAGGTHRYDERIGVDINPRAVTLAGFNAALNGHESCRFSEQNIFESTGDLGSFDLVTWNTPMRFFPESFRTSNLDGYGGHMGIEIGLKLVDALPDLLAVGGVAYLKTLGPVLRDGRRVLDEELLKRSSSRKLDTNIFILQSTWDTQLREFHARFNITRFEDSILEIRRGKGTLRRVETPIGERMMNGVRWLTHSLRKAGVLGVPPRPPNR